MRATYAITLGAFFVALNACPPTDETLTVDTARSLVQTYLCDTDTVGVEACDPTRPEWSKLSLFVDGAEARRVVMPTDDGISELATFRITELGWIMIPSRELLLAREEIIRANDTYSQARLSAMKSDLRNLAAAMEAYFADNLTYTATLTELDFNSSHGVTVTISNAGRTGWTATATHSGTSSSCELYYGKGQSPAIASNEGVVECQ